MKFNKAVDKYLEWGQRHYSTRTLELYVDHLRRFERFIENKDVEKIKVIEDVIGYCRHLEKRQVADNTINLSMIALRQMWKTLAGFERELKIKLPFLWGVIPVKKGITAKSHKPVTPDEFKNLLIAINGSQGFLLARDACLFRILYDTGMRVSELTSLNVSSIKEGEQAGR